MFVGLNSFSIMVFFGKSIDILKGWSFKWVCDIKDSHFARNYFKKFWSVIYFEFLRNSSSDVTKLWNNVKYYGFSGPKCKQNVFYKYCNWQYQVILFNPLYLVFILLIRYFSLSFLTAGSELKIFSTIVTLIEVLIYSSSFILA